MVTIKAPKMERAAATDTWVSVPGAPGGAPATTMTWRGTSRCCSRRKGINLVPRFAERGQGMAETRSGPTG
jgi:hypothetical protein